MALTDHPVLLCTFCCIVVWFPCTKGCCSGISWYKFISTKQRDVAQMDVEENLVKLFWHLLVHVERCSGVAVLKVVSKLCQHWVCRSRKEHGFGNIWKRRRMIFKFLCQKCFLTILTSKYSGSRSILSKIADFLGHNKKKSEKRSLKLNLVTLNLTHEDPTTLSKINIDVVEAWELTTLVKPTPRIWIDSPNSPRWILSQKKPWYMTSFNQNVSHWKLTQSLKYHQDPQELCKQGNLPFHKVAAYIQRCP